MYAVPVAPPIGVHDAQVFGREIFREHYVTDWEVNEPSENSQVPGVAV